MFIFKNVKFKHILDISNLKIEKNSITSILGESGSGKTTILRLMNKLISADTGQILYDNSDIEKINSIDIRKEVVMLPQNPVIFEGSIRDNLLIGLKFADLSIVDDKKLLEIMKMVHLNKDLDTDSINLSGGERQRLALARVILLDPKVLLLDEPSSALDEKTEENMISDIVKYVRDTNKTLIMILHSKRIANKYSDYIVEIESGKIIDYTGEKNE